MQFNPGRIKMGLNAALLAVLTGCVGYVDGGYYGGTVVVPAPDLYIYGGGFEHERGGDARHYSERGHESREEAHRGGRGHDR